MMNPITPQIWSIWIAQVPLLGKERYNRRPVILLSDHELDEKVTVIPVSSQLVRPQRATHIYMDEPCLARPSRALCEFVTTISTADLIRPIGFLEEPFLRYSICHALAVHLNLPELTPW